MPYRLEADKQTKRVNSQNSDILNVSFYGTLPAPLYIFAILLCLFIQMSQRSILKPIDAIPGTHLVISGFYILHDFRYG